MFRTISLITVALLLQACFELDSVNTVSDKASYKPGQVPAVAYLEHKEVYNPESVIPPQCYTKTEGKNNPCYACHQSYSRSENRSNMMSDGDLQGNYEFSEVGETNSWKNLFVDRTEIIAGISNEHILSWIKDDNYQPFVKTLEQNKSHLVIDNLAEPAKAFGDSGVAKDGSHWIAFNYKPFPSTFWPTNGSTGDAMIRLPKAFREVKGEYSFDVYFANLGLVELTMKGLDKVSVPTISEQTLQRDLNGNGILEQHITEIVKQDSYVGDASSTQVADMLYPENTEFLHTVRYLGVDENGNVYNAQRMKEVRYMKKHGFKSRNRLKTAYMLEAKEKLAETLPKTINLGKRGIDNGFGWTINGYIESADGTLRQQQHQELAFCNGCHKTVGSTIDQTFSFPRKLAGAKGWGYIDLTKMNDAPSVGERQGEFLTYFERVGGGDEFRQNKEMLARWFNKDGSVKKDKVEQVQSLYELIMPSKERAIDLNKAYYSIVQEQSYIFGRDATLAKATNVLEAVDTEQPPLLPEHQHAFDIRLNWQQQQEQTREN